MEQLTNALKRILKWIKTNDSHRASIWQTGLSLSEIEERVKVLPFCLPQEVYELYKWRNGFIPGTRGWMQGFGGHDFYNLDFVIKNYFNQIEYCKTCAVLDNNPSSEPLRNPQWFSLLGHDKRDYFVIGEQEQKQESPVFCFDYGDWDDFRPKLKYSSLTSMMLTIAECYETGAYYHYKVEGREITSFGMNYPAAESIRKKYNPDCEYDAPIEELL
ncbi:MAG: SMI1/KNR4 family protein [Microcoleus sp.]